MSNRYSPTRRETYRHSEQARRERIESRRRARHAKALQTGALEIPKER